MITTTTNAQEIIETVQSDIVPGIDAALYAIQSLTDAKQTLFSYLSCQKTLLSEKKSLEQVVVNLRDEKRQLEREIEKSKKDLQDISTELEMKQNKASNQDYTDEAPSNPPPTPTSEPNEDERDSNVATYSSDSTLETISGDMDTVVELAEESNMEKAPSMPMFMEDVAASNTSLLEPTSRDAYAYAESVEERETGKAPSMPMCVSTECMNRNNDRVIDKATSETRSCDTAPHAVVELSLQEEKEIEVSTCMKDAENTVPFLTQVSAEEKEEEEEDGACADPYLFDEEGDTSGLVSRSAEEDVLFHYEGADEEFSTSSSVEPSSKSNIVTPPSKKRRYSNANHQSPKKWRRMVRTQRLQSILFGNIY